MFSKYKTKLKSIFIQVFSMLFYKRPELIEKLMTNWMDAQEDGNDSSKLLKPYMFGLMVVLFVGMVIAGSADSIITYGITLGNTNSVWVSVLVAVVVAFIIQFMLNASTSVGTYFLMKEHYKTKGLRTISFGIFSTFFIFLSLTLYLSFQTGDAALALSQSPTLLSTDSLKREYNTSLAATAALHDEAINDYKKMLNSNNSIEQSIAALNASWSQELKSHDQRIRKNKDGQHYSWMVGEKKNAQNRYSNKLQKLIEQKNNSQESHANELNNLNAEKKAALALVAQTFKNDLDILNHRNSEIKNSNTAQINRFSSMVIGANFLVNLLVVFINFIITKWVITAKSQSTQSHSQQTVNHNSQKQRPIGFSQNRVAAKIVNDIEAENMKNLVNKDFSQDSQQEDSQVNSQDSQKEVVVIHDNVSTVKLKLNRIAKYVNKANSNQGRPETIIKNLDNDMAIIDSAIKQANGVIPSNLLENIEGKKQFLRQYKIQHATTT